MLDLQTANALAGFHRLNVVLLLVSLLSPLCFPAVVPTSPPSLSLFSCCCCPHIPAVLISVFFLLLSPHSRHPYLCFPAVVVPTSPPFLPLLSCCLLSCCCCPHIPAILTSVVLLSVVLLLLSPHPRHPYLCCPVVCCPVDVVPTSLPSLPLLSCCLLSCCCCPHIPAILTSVVLPAYPPHPPPPPHPIPALQHTCTITSPPSLPLRTTKETLSHRGRWRISDNKQTNKQTKTKN